MQTPHIRSARMEELDEIMAMYEHSRGIMRANGNHGQWVGGYPTRDLVDEDIRTGISHVVVDGGGLAGVFVLVEGRDPTYSEIEGGSWAEDGRPYATIHRMACAAGRHGVFAASLEWCRRQATSLRIDTHADNAIMLHLMERHGFDYRGIIHLADGSERRAFQMLDTGELCKPLTDYVEREILPQYDHFDSAHRRDHAEQVIGKSLELAKHYNVNLNMVYAIAAYHDIGLRDGRERHHIVSGVLLRGDANLRRWFGAEQVVTMAEAVEDHRASAGQAPRSLYGKIVAEADRDIEPMRIIRRTVQFGLSHYPELDKESQWRRAVEHLHEKYAEGGYLRLWIPESDNARQLQRLRETIADEGRLRRLFEDFYADETQQKA